MKKLAFAVIALLCAAAGALTYLAQRVVVLDPKPAACPAAERSCERYTTVDGWLGVYDTSLTRDGCLRARIRRVLGKNREVFVYEQQSDGTERPRWLAVQAWRSTGVAHACPNQALEPLPEYWWRTDVVASTWWGYSTGESQPAERVERSIAKEGREITETHFTRQGEQWVAGAPRTVKVDIAPDKMTPRFGDQMKRNADY